MYFPFLCLSILFASVASEDVKVGNFENYAHGISGEVFVKDDKTLIIKGKICKIVNKPSVESAIYYLLHKGRPVFLINFHSF